MIRSHDHASRVQERRQRAGKRGIAKAVRRFFKRVGGLRGGRW